MKKITAAILTVAFLLGTFSSCNVTPTPPTDDDPDDGIVEDQDTLFDVLIGESLTLKTVNGVGEALCNNSGMSGLWSSNHLHAAFDGTTDNGKKYIEESMYASSEANQAIYFDLGSIQALGQMCIWNYGDISDLDSGVKEIQVFYSEDNAEYTYLDSFTLAKASAEDSAEHGGFIASNLADSGLPIDLGGISARYVGIIPVSNYGGSKYGLSEVRIFRHKTRPAEGDLVYGESFTPRTDSNASNVTNNTGMSHLSATKSTAETADNIPFHMWYSDKSAQESLLIVNLDGTYPLDTLKIWNYNDPDNLDAGIKAVEIYYTTAEACNIVTSQTEQDYYDFESGSWERLGVYTIPCGTGEEALAASLEIDLKGIHVQHLKLKPVSNYGGTDAGFGLSEIRVYSSTGWAIEPDRLWTGIVNTSGSFKYHGNFSEDPFAVRDQGSGWMGGDGCFSTSLTGSQLQGSVNSESITLFTFQDSFNGNMGNYRVFNWAKGYSDSPGFALGMQNMAYMRFEGDVPDVRNVQFYRHLNGNLSESHPLQNILPGSYWIGDSTVIDGKVYTAANKFSGLALVSRDFYEQEMDESGFINMNKVAVLAIEGADDYLPDNINFEPLYEEGEYIYQYGRKDNKLIVRRTTAEEYKTLTGWKYWDGEGWSDSLNDVAKISEGSIGNEFNVTYMQTGAFAGKYVAVFTQGSIWGSVTCAVSDSITGPFKRLREVSDTSVLYWATERYEMGMNGYKESNNYYVQWNYNAKSQPAISKENELLITYHFGLHDDRVPSWGFFSALGKEYEQPTFIKLIVIE